MRWLVLAAMIGAGSLLGPLLILLWTVLLFTAVGAASLLSAAGTMLRLVRRT